MSIAAIVNAEQARARAPRHRLSVAHYHRMGDAGIFHEDDRVELVDDELFRMVSVGSLHSGIVIRLESRFGALAGDRYLVSTQNPIQIPPYSERSRTSYCCGLVPTPIAGRCRALPTYRCWSRWPTRASNGIAT
jgi:hypothetical protein